MFGKILATTVILATALAAIVAVGLNRSTAPPQVIYVSAEEAAQMEREQSAEDSSRDRITLADLDKPMIEIRRAGFRGAPTVGPPPADTCDGPTCSLAR